MGFASYRGVGLVVCLALASLSNAQGESLADAWRMALQNDASIGAARSDVEAAEEDRNAASRSRFPVLEANGSYAQFKKAPSLDVATPAGALQARIWKHDGYAAGSVDVSVPIWTSGRISGAIGAANAGLDGARAQQSRSTADVKLAVAECYIAVFRTRRMLAVAESNVASLRANAEDIGVMYDKESVPKSDLLAAKVALSNAEQQRMRAAHALRLAQAAYNRQVGQPLDRTVELEEPAAKESVATGEPLERMTTLALERRPEFAALQAQREALGQQARAERAQALPQLALRAGYNHFESEILDRQNFASVGVGFQWRLFDSGQIAARTSALRGRARAVDQRWADLRSLISLEVETAVLNRDDAAARVRAAGEAVEQAEENLRSTRELYGSGLATNTQVLDAESLRVRALSNRDDARFDLLIAGYRIERAVGDL